MILPKQVLKNILINNHCVTVTYWHTIETQQDANQQD
jgi:hypothetical protein